MTLPRAVKLYKLPAAPLTPGIRPMEQKDVKQVRSSATHLLFDVVRSLTYIRVVSCVVSRLQVAALIKAYLVRFGLAPVFSKNEVAHWFLPRTDVIVSYVVEDKATGKITDFLSFYSLPSTIIGNPTYKTLRYILAPPVSTLNSL
jgi:glycylpeptide N-tetradecanoyltransferase